MRSVFLPVVGACLFLTACESTSEQRFASYETERQAYFSCGYQAGGYIKKRNPGVDPYTLENSATALCGKERAAVVDGVIKAHGSGAWRGIIATFDRKFAESVSLGSLKA
jgi:hypothetical protein